MNNKINEIFLNFGYVPRLHQIEAVKDILKAFENGKRHIFLDAPTGSGKSLIAIVAQKMLNKNGVIITATNSLCNQYHKDFPSLPLIIGANNYSCELRKSLSLNNNSAEFCYKKSRFYYDRFITEPEQCINCEFKKSRMTKNISSLAITNYSYYIIDQLFISEKTNGVSSFNAELAIFDEAHLINEQFSQHYIIYYNKARGLEFINDIRILCGDYSNLEKAYKNAFNIIDENIARGSIGKINFMKFVDILEKFYLKMLDIIETKKIYSTSENNYDSLFALERKYHGMFCKIDDLKKFNYEVIVDVKKNEHSLSIVPVFVGKTSEHMLRPYNLFMSATINQAFLIKTLELNPNDCALVKVPYSFNQNDKTLNFNFASRRVNWSNMNDETTLNSLKEDIKEISKLHENQNGIVIVTSFNMAKNLANNLSISHDVILHKAGMNAKEIIQSFKSKKEKPTILISPSLFEGVDFPGDESQFQILVKAPYLSLACKRMFYISRKHQAVYNQLSLMRMIQAFGRSTRNIDDKSITYVLDTNCSRLFKSKHNDSWRNQFSITT